MSNGLLDDVSIDGCGSDCTTERIFVTPKMASRWLAKNVGNRRVSRADVEFLRRQILGGKWHVTHQGIAFYEDGDLADGQHRLSAIVAAGRGVWTNVTWNLPREVIHAIDRGRARNNGDTAGFCGLKIDNTRMAVCNVLIKQYRVQGTDNGWSTERVDSQDFMVFYRAYLPAVEFAQFMMGRRHANAVVSGAVAAAWFTCDRDRLEQFKAVMSNGMVSGEKDMAAVRLRDLLTGNFRGGTSHARCELFQKSCSALRAFLEGRPIAKLYATATAAFPIPSPEDLSAK